ncbi:MAG: FAD-dependent oxidoreductase [Desulforegulaceae bacterium]|nr:FAD-dependent oxidoreductase [Desulforegulaceae bacterium]
MTKLYLQKDPLFAPVKIGKLELENRIYLPAMHLGMADNFEVTQRLEDFYHERALGGAGLICVGYATIDDKSGNVLNIGAHKDEFIPGLKRLSDSIKNGGSKSCIQLNHSGRYNFSFFIGNRPAVAPSAIASKMTGETPHPLSEEEILEIVENFGKAAKRCKDAGFDAVEVLNGTGYLISAFLSPLTNKRTDKYGGSLENRMRFGLEVMQSVRNYVGKDYPVLARINGNDMMPGGQDRHELKIYAKLLADKKLVDSICINVGWHEGVVPQIQALVPRAAFGYLTREMKEILDIPVIASHRINDPQTARELIADEICDMVAMGRSLIADPYLPKKAKEGREKEIIHCIACAQGCFDNLMKLKAVECLCNPRASYERETKIEKSDFVKKVMVIGGGAAGMSAALSAFERGHDVTLYESSDKLGGQLFLAAAPPGRAEFEELAKDLDYQIRMKNIKVNFNTIVDEELIKKENPDHIILATGAKPLSPPIEGADKPHVVQAWDVLDKKVFTGTNVVVIGGGAVGVETAIFLGESGAMSSDIVKFLLVNKAEDPEVIRQRASKGTKNITLIEMTDNIGKDIGKTTRWTMIQEIERIGIKTGVQTKALKIEDDRVIVETSEGKEEIWADSVVLAAGSKSENSLLKIIENLEIPFDCVGDSKNIGLAFHAVHQGFRAGMKI